MRHWVRIAHSRFRLRSVASGSATLRRYAPPCAGGFVLRICDFCCTMLHGVAPGCIAPRPAHAITRYRIRLSKSILSLLQAGLQKRNDERAIRRREPSNSAEFSDFRAEISDSGVAASRLVQHFPKLVIRHDLAVLDVVDFILPEPCGVPVVEAYVRAALVTPYGFTGGVECA